MSNDEIMYNDYDCPYCKKKFNARSGKLSKKGGIVKNHIKCPHCKNGLKNLL